VLRVIWWKMNTCGNEGKQRAILGNTAVMMLTWTVASAVFDALDIFATILYDVESPAGYFSAGFSFLSVWYGLFQRKNDLDVLGQIGTKKINVAQELADRKRKLNRALAKQKKRFQQWRGDATGASGQPEGAKAAGVGTFARPSLGYTDVGGGISRIRARLPKVPKSLRKKRSSSAAALHEGEVEMTEVVANDPVVELTEVVAQADVANPVSGADDAEQSSFGFESADSAAL
jgi:hypothetical protein